jgi:hypothetical protein
VATQGYKQCVGQGCGVPVSELLESSPLVLLQVADMGYLALADC